MCACLLLRARARATLFSSMLRIRETTTFFSRNIISSDAEGRPTLRSYPGGTGSEREVSRSSANAQRSLVRHRYVSVRYARGDTARALFSFRVEGNVRAHLFERNGSERDTALLLSPFSVLLVSSPDNCFEKQSVRAVRARTRPRWTQAVFVVRKRPSARRGPGIVSVDRNVRSNCRCSCVLQFTR